MTSTWLTLESTPDIINAYMEKLGVSTKWCTTDVLGLDPEVLAFVPQPVKAVIVLVPTSPSYEKHCSDIAEKQKTTIPDYPKSLFFMKQIIRNACGTIALVHAILNNEDIELEDGILKNYYEKTKDLSPEERGKILEADDAFIVAHREAAEVAQVRDAAEHIPHFIALIQKDGELYELDGCKSYPVKHGSTSDESFLQDAAKVCKEYVNRDPNNVSFAVIAVVPKVMD